jgi:hypothetical protein
MENNAPLKPPEYKRNELGQFDRPGKRMSNAQKPNKKMGEIAEVEIKRSPGRPKGSANKVTVALKEAILQAGENVGGEKGLVGYLERLAVENSSAYAGLLAKILPHQLAASADSHGGVTEIRFTRVIVHPNGHKEIEGVTPKQIPPPTSHMLPSQSDSTDDTNDIK